MNVIDFVKKFAIIYDRAHYAKKMTIIRLFPNIYEKVKTKYTAFDKEMVEYAESIMDPKTKEEYLLKAEKRRLRQQINIEIKQANCEKKIKEVKITDGKHPISKKYYDPSNVKKNIPIKLSENKIQITGTIDIVFSKDGAHDLVIYYGEKTNINGISDISGLIPMLKFPLDHIQDLPFHKAMIRLSILAYGFEKTGAVIKDLIIVSKKKAIVVPYKKWEVRMMLKYYKYVKNLDYSYIFKLERPENSEFELPCQPLDSQEHLCP